MNEYIISEIDRNYILCHPEDIRYIYGVMEYSRLLHQDIPTSKELLLLAHTDFKNREERKGLHDQPSWVSGWITGFLSERKPEWSKRRDEKIVKNEKEKVLESQYLNDLEMQIGCSMMLFTDHTPENIESAYLELNEEIVRFIKFLRGSS